MSAKEIMVLWLILFLTYQFWMILLTILNLRNRTDSVALPDVLKTIITTTVAVRIDKYLKAHSRLNICIYGLQTLSALIIVTTGLFGTIDSLLTDWLMNKRIYSPLFSSVIFVLLIAFANRLLFLPFTLFRQFSIEAQFGFSNVTINTFLLDKAKIFVLIMSIGVPSLLVFFGLIAAGTRHWWIYAFFFIAGLQLLTNFLYQPLIAPLFNKFYQLAEGSLKLRLKKLAERLKFKIRSVLIVDNSRRSSHSNAYFSGFGRTKSVVLFDTLVETLNERQIEAIVAHEIGHQKLFHVPKHLILNLCMTFIGLWLTSFLLHYPTIFTAFGFHLGGIGQISGHATIVVFYLLSGPVGSFVQPLVNHWLRRHEYDADIFSASAIGGSAALADALINLSRDNLTNPNPHPLYRAVHYTHPTLIQRLNRLQEQTESS